MIPRPQLCGGQRIQILFVLLLFCCFGAARSQETCIRIGSRFTELDAGFRDQLVLQKFSDHEVWQKDKCYLVVVNGKITSYDNQDRCFSVCEAIEMKKSKESIENWILKTLSEFGTGSLLEGYTDPEESVSYISRQSFQRYWFSDYYLILYYTSTIQSTDGFSDSRERSVRIPVHGISLIVGRESPYYLQLRRNAYWILDEITAKRQKKDYQAYPLYVDDKGEQNLSIKLSKAFQDLRKYYTAPPEKKDLY